MLPIRCYLYCLHWDDYCQTSAFALLPEKAFRGAHGTAVLGRRTSLAQPTTATWALHGTGHRSSMSGLHQCGKVGTPGPSKAGNASYTVVDKSVSTDYVYRK